MWGEWDSSLNSIQVQRAMSIEKSKAKLEEAIQEYVDAFCEKHEIELDFWISDQPGTIAQFGDYYFDFETIRFDLETFQPAEVLMEWYDATMELGVKQEPIINYSSWLKGART